MASGSWSTGASLRRRWRAIGGRLRIDDDRLVFAPHALERATGAEREAFSVPLADVVALGRAPRTLLSPRRELVVTTRDGRRGQFLVNRLDSVIDAIASRVDRAGGSARIIPEDDPGPDAGPMP